MPFRLSARNLYLTYPHCPLPIPTIIGLLNEKFARYHRVIENWLACLEKHADDTMHAHVVLWLDGRVDTRDALFADLSFGTGSFPQVYHGNYQTMLNEQACVLYVTKEPLWDSNNTLRIRKIIDRKTKKCDLIANRLIAGATLAEIATEFPGMTLMYLSRLRTFQAWITAQRFTPIPLPHPNMDPSPQDALIMRWILVNLLGVSRVLRQRQMYIHGAPGTGKSTLIQTLESSFKTYKPSFEVHWWDEFDDTIQLIVFDEFKGQVKATTMNKILDGQTMIIPRRGGDFSKTKNIGVIICSNYPPSEVYQNSDSVLAFIDRLLYINVTDFINIFKS